MASTVCKFQSSFDKAFHGIPEVPQTWKNDLLQLTNETKTMLKEAEKSQEKRQLLFESIDKLNNPQLDQKRAKEVLMSLVSALPEAGLQIQLSRKTNQEIYAALFEKCTAIFSKSTFKSQPVSSVSSGRNLQIIKTLASQPIKESQDPSGIKKTNTFAAVNLNVQELFSEIKFKSTQPIHHKAIEHIELLSREVEKMTTAGADSCSYQALKSMLNEARGAMQTAQEIIIDLAKYDDFNSQTLKQQVQDLKENLEKKVDYLNLSMETLIASDNCAQAVMALEQKQNEEEITQFSKAIDLYQETSAKAIAIVKVEGEIREAEIALKKIEESQKVDVVAAQVAIESSNKALEQTSKALETFVEIKAACRNFKSPLLDKLRNAQKTLTAQTQKVVENPKLKEAIESTNKPEVKTILDQETTKLTKTVVQAQAAIENLDNPQTIQFSEKQKEFILLLNKAIADESKLDEPLKKDISALGKRAIPLLKIIEAKQLSKADGFSLAQTAVDYIDILTFIYEKLDEASDTSIEEYNKHADQLRKDGIHDLADFMNKEYYTEFNNLSSEIEKLIGSELLQQFSTKLSGVWAIKGKIEGKWKS